MRKLLRKDSFSWFVVTLVIFVWIGIAEGFLFSREGFASLVVAYLVFYFVSVIVVRHLEKERKRLERKYKVRISSDRWWLVYKNGKLMTDWRLLWKIFFPSKVGRIAFFVLIGLLIYILLFPILAK